MRHPRPLIAILALGGVVVGRGAGLRAQTPPDSALRPPTRDTTAQPAPPPARTCWHPRPLARCRRYWVVEAGVYSRVAGSTVTRAPAAERPQLTNHLSWEVGHMANVGPAAAVGGAVFLGANGFGERWGAKVRYRRWLPGSLALDVGAGPVSVASRLPVPATSDLPRSGRGVGATGDVSVMWKSAVGVTMRADAVRAGGGTAHGLYGGGQLGSGAAVAGTVAFAAAVAVAVLALASAWGG